jgi:hypothetical protein
MTVRRSQESVHQFYAAALAAGSDTAEALNADVSPGIRSLIDQARDLGLEYALDLGYGMGNHALAMLEAGLRVVAVDQAAPDRLAAAVTQRGLNPDCIQIRQCLLETFVPPEGVGLVIAKDVLHYLGRDHVVRILASMVNRSTPGALHHLEVFCDIWRITGEDTPVVIEGEAAFKAGEFIGLVRGLYAEWDLAISQEPHVERDGRSDTPYFTATRIVVTARRMSQHNESFWRGDRA